MEEIIKNALDLHVHVGPEIIPRKYTIETLVNSEKGKISGVAVKNHFFPTVAMNRTESELQIFDSVVLNRYLGGLNPYIIKASAELSKNRIIVWFPTLHTDKFLEGKKEEIPQEWTGGRKLSENEGVSSISINIRDSSGKLTSDVLNVLETIKKYDCVLATGHLSWEDSYMLVSTAIKDYGISRIIITHPIYQRIQMPVKIQKELADLGAYMEHCFSMYSIDKISIKEIAKQIISVGPEKCILSSDVGQIFSKSPSEVLLEFCNLLSEQGISDRDLEKMLCDNPRKIVLE